MGAYQRTIWPNRLPPLLRRAGDQRQYEALRAFYMDGLSSSVKVRGGTADPSGSSNRIANSPMLGQFRSVEIQASQSESVFHWRIKLSWAMSIHARSEIFPLL